MPDNSSLEFPNQFEKETNKILEKSSRRSTQVEHCCVVNVMSQTRHCAVVTESGDYISGLNWPGDGSQVPERGEGYIITYGTGKPTLIDNQSQPTRKQNTVNPDSSIADDIGSENFAYQGEGTGSPDPSKPTDVVSGDWVKHGDEGNLLGVLKGGTSILKASEMAQVIATQTRHLLQLIGKNASIKTGAGTLDFETNDGKSSIVLKTGSDEETETHPDRENFRVHLELGDEGQIADFRITDHKGHTQYQYHVDENGRVSSRQSRKTEITENDKREEIQGNKKESIGGNESRQVDGSVDENIRGSFEKRVSGNARIKAASDAAFQSLKDLALSSRRNLDITATGAMIPGEGVGRNTSMQFTAVNGGVEFDVGNPASGDTLVDDSSFDVSTFRGDISFESKLGNIKCKTYRPGSIHLGGPVPNIFSGMLFETFNAFMQLFGTMIDTHTHISQSPGTPTSPPIVPIWSTTQPLLRLAKSRYVKMGG